MPKGNPTAQTKATERYREKVGIITKSFHVKREIAERFKDACDRSGEPQSAVIVRFMEEYIKETESR